jgi:hypothetical protein
LENSLSIKKNNSDYSSIKILNCINENKEFPPANLETGATVIQGYQNKGREDGALIGQPVSRNYNKAGYTVLSQENYGNGFYYWRNSKAWHHVISDPAELYDKNIMTEWYNSENYFKNGTIKESFSHDNFGNGILNNNFRGPWFYIRLPLKICLDYFVLVAKEKFGPGKFRIYGRSTNSFTDVLFTENSTHDGLDPQFGYVLLHDQTNDDALGAIEYNAVACNGLIVHIKCKNISYDQYLIIINSLEKNHENDERLVLQQFYFIKV